MGVRKTQIIVSNRGLVEGCGNENFELWLCTSSLGGKEEVAAADGGRRGCRALIAVRALSAAAVFFFFFHPFFQCAPLQAGLRKIVMVSVFCMDLRRRLKLYT